MLTGTPAATEGCVKLDYALNDAVHISQLETTGRVVGVYISETGVQFNVRYFYNGDAKTVYFYSDELAARK